MLTIMSAKGKIGYQCQQILVIQYQLPKYRLNSILVQSRAHKWRKSGKKGKEHATTMQRLKFENVLKVVLLLLLACTRMCTNMCMETSQRMRKASTRTPFVRKGMVIALEKCAMTM